MKKIIFTLFLMIGAICANAQTAKIYKGGTVVGTYTDADSVVFRQTTVPVDESTHAFSVSKRKQVVFASGNLQYTQSTKTWAFAANQYDIIGDANVSDGALADKIDLFGWSTDNTATPFGVSLSTITADYAGDFVDWGTNTIGTDAPNTWRTLTNDEWTYLCHTRTNADNLIGVACITLSGSSYVNGLIVLPDDWSSPLGVVFKSGFAENYGEEYYATYQTLSLSDWQQMEAAGAVFLPAAGYREGSDVDEVGSFGVYYSATPYNEGNARSQGFDSGGAATNNWASRSNGLSVRLVKDFGEPAMPSGKFFVAADKQITFSPGNLQYTQSTKTWSFAANQYDIIGAANISDGALADNIDLFGWSSTNTATPFGVSLSTDKTDYSGDFVDWGTNTIDTDAPNTWRTLTNDEWTYLFQHTHWTMAKMNGILGFMLLPDGFVAPAGLTVAVLGDGNLSGTDLRFNESDYAGNVYTAAEFAQLESLGVVFLPCAGYRNGSNVVTVDSYGAYWSATPNVSDNAKYLSFSSSNAGTYDWGNRDGGRSVRLVQDVQTPAAGSPAHTSTESTKEITTQVVTVYQPGGKVSRFNDVDSVVFVETSASVLPGAFSVSADKKINFSAGNLQYTQSTKTWAFAEHQYDIIGAANVSGSALADKIDLFGWSANSTTAPFGVSLSTNEADYAGDFVDWGINTIGTDAPNTWRTLTYDEWTYLCHTRTNADNLIGVACITLSGSSYVNGLIVLPDDWSSPSGVVFKSGFAEDSGEAYYATYQTLSLSEWQQMEAAGAVFLPAAGYRGGSDVDEVGSFGNYWSATPDDEDSARFMSFDSNRAGTDFWGTCDSGYSVRLVKDL